MERGVTTPENKTTHRHEDVVQVAGTAQTEGLAGHTVAPDGPDPEVVKNQRAAERSVTAPRPSWVSQHVGRPENSH